MSTSSIPERHRCHGINRSDESRKPVEPNKGVIKVKCVGDKSEQVSVRSTGKSNFRGSYLLQLFSERKMAWHQTYSFVGVQGADHSGCNKTNYGMRRDFATEMLCPVDQLSSTFLI
jgi:hypothetical protein